MALILEWIFGKSKGSGEDGDDDDPNKKKPPSLPKSSHSKDVGAAKKKIHHMEKQRQNLYAKSKMYKDEATGFGKKAGACKNPSNKAAFKRKGLVALRKSKMYEGQAEKFGQMLMNYELTALEAENMSATVEIVQGMKEMQGTMAAVAAEVNGDDVSDMLQDIEETMVDYGDVLDSLSKPMHGTVIIDDVDMEKEFDAFMDDEADRIAEEEEAEALRKLESMEKVPAKVPTKKPVVVNQQEKKEEEKEGEEMNIVE